MFIVHLIGIACGIKKSILLFITSEIFFHDPVSVIDPIQYDAMYYIDNDTNIEH